MTMELRGLLKNTSALIGPLMALGMTLLLKYFYSSMTESPEELEMALAMALNFGLSMNIGMGAIMMSALSLAEEKEKNTLRSLMTSSVNSKQFLVGSLIPPLVITFIINYLLLFLSGLDLQSISMFTSP